MIVSRARTLGALVLLASLAALPAWPQGGAPLRLNPGAIPDGAAPAAPGVEPQIRVEGLQDVDLEAIGLLDVSQGGLGADMWSGTPRVVVERLLLRLPADLTGRAGRALMRRLLLSTAQPPAGDDKGANLAALRVEQLLTMGDFAAAAELLAAAPGRETDADLMRAAAQLHLYAYDHERACTLVTKVAEKFGAGFWQRALIYCQALAGEQTEALFGVDLLREAGEADDTFIALIEVLLGGDAVEDGPGQATPLMLALRQAAMRPVPAVYITSPNPAILRAIAEGDNVDMALRLEAAQRAEAVGALSTENLAAIFNLVEFTEAETADPSGAAQADGSLRGEALLYRAARGHEVPTARAELLRQMLNQARERGAYATAARLAAPMLADMPPSSELVWFAGDAARALLAAGRSRLALPWYRLAQSAASTDGNAAVAEMVLWPILRLALGSGATAVEVADAAMPAAAAAPAIVVRRPAPISPIAWDDARLTAWRSTREVFAPDSANDQAMMLYAMFEALDEPLAEADWQSLVGTRATAPVARAPAAEMWFGLQRAAEQGRRGETILRALVMLGEGGMSNTDPIVLATVVRNLVRLGLVEEARALAVDAALAAGL